MAANGLTKISPQKWKVIRTRWECDPRPGYRWIVKELNLPVSDVAVIRRAKKEGWAKQVSLHNIANQAQLKADQAFGMVVVEAQDPDVSHDKPELVSRLTEKSVDLRTEVIENHRREWRKHRSEWDIEVFLRGERIKILREKYANSDLSEEEVMEEIQARIAKGFDVDLNYYELSNFARCAKTMAETIKIRQDGERRAWGLDAVAEDTGAGVDPVERMEARHQNHIRKSEEMKQRMLVERASLTTNRDHGKTLN